MKKLTGPLIAACLSMSCSPAVHAEESNLDEVIVLGG